MMNFLGPAVHVGRPNWKRAGMRLHLTTFERQGLLHGWLWWQEAESCHLLQLVLMPLDATNYRTWGWNCLRMLLWSATCHGYRDCIAEKKMHVLVQPQSCQQSSVGENSGTMLNPSCDQCPLKWKRSLDESMNSTPWLQECDRPHRSWEKLWAPHCSFGGLPEKRTSAISFSELNKPTLTSIPSFNHLRGFNVHQRDLNQMVQHGFAAAEHGACGDAARWNRGGQGPSLVANAWAKMVAEGRPSAEIISLLSNTRISWFHVTQIFPSKLENKNAASQFKPTNIYGYHGTIRRLHISKMGPNQALTNIGGKKHSWGLSKTRQRDTGFEGAWSCVPILLLHHEGQPPHDE